MVTCSVEKQVIKCGVEGGEGIGVGVRGEREGEGVDVNEREIGGRGGGSVGEGEGRGSRRTGSKAACHASDAFRAVLIGVPQNHGYTGVRSLAPRILAFIPPPSHTLMNGVL